ncbi:MAG: hypothetical protein P8P22_00680 [Porticoccaceae bacterium]|nr:hypothetical protein [Porticoccaceae bacterium]MDG1306637.1 hypothetical protein [Porticoccaceae bacterium]
MTEQTEITAKQRGFQYQIWIMLIIVFGVILAGFLMVPKTEEQRLAMMARMGTTNQGEIVSPTVDMGPLLAALPQGEAPKWKVVAAGGEGCNQGCQDVLTNSRQIHMLLGKSSGRLERIYLPDTASLELIDMQELQAVHPYLVIEPIDNLALSEVLRGSSAEWDMMDTRYFVVTPDYQAVLFYTQQHDGGGLLEDLKHLLKYSPNR